MLFTMAVIPLIRQGVLGVMTFFSLIVLAISAHLVSQTQQYFNGTTTFSGLGVAVAMISLVTLPVMLVVDFIRRGAFTSMIVVELVWLSILWILWVATAAEMDYGYGLNFPLGCHYGDVIYNGMCQETQAIEAFSFLNLIIVLLYTGFLFFVAVIAARRDRSIWLSSVKESFGSLAGPAQHSMTEYNASAPPQPRVGHPTETPIQPQYTAVPTYPATTPGGPAIAV